MKIVHPPPLLANSKSIHGTVSKNGWLRRHPKGMEQNYCPIVLEVMICEIKYYLKPILWFYVLGGNRWRWIRNSWNMKALWNICKNQVHTGYSCSSSLVASFFVTWVLSMKTKLANIWKFSECTHSNLKPFWLTVHHIQGREIKFMKMRPKLLSSMLPWKWNSLSRHIVDSTCPCRHQALVLARSF